MAQWVSGGQRVPPLCASRAGNRMGTSDGTCGSGVSPFVGERMTEMGLAGDGTH